MEASGLVFGIYPLSPAGTPTGLATGPADNDEKIHLALQDLRGTKKLIPRVYLIYTKQWEAKMFALAERYQNSGLLGDLVIGCGDWTDMDDETADMSRWLEFIRTIISRYGSSLSSLQITNEPNLTFMEGSKAYIMQALTEGIIAARHEIDNGKLTVKLGFGSVPESPMSVPQFWSNLARIDGQFQRCVDFVGHNFYVDVFTEGTLSYEEITSSVETLLRDLRRKMNAAAIPKTVPIRVTENGWPTGKNPFNGMERPYERQADVMERIIRTILCLKPELNITQYTLFGLRDADSTKEDPFHQFGIMKDDYTPKPAYRTFKRLIEELGL